MALNPFPLCDWFDTSKRICEIDVDLTEAQMAIYALKSGQDPDGMEAKRTYRQMRAAVKAHNSKFAGTQ